MIFFNSVPGFVKEYEKPQREYEEDVALMEDEDEVYKLVLWNDDVNTYLTELINDGAHKVAYPQ